MSRDKENGGIGTGNKTIKAIMDEKNDEVSLSELEVLKAQNANRIKSIEEQYFKSTTDLKTFKERIIEKKD
jgi:hypothetical protein